MSKTVKVQNIEIGSGIPKICIPVVGINIREIEEQCRSAVSAGADLVEWRADHYEGVELPEAVNAALSVLEQCLKNKETGSKVPLLFTVRTDREGGNWVYEKVAYEAILLHAALSGMVDLVDVEVFPEPEKTAEFVAELQDENVKVIASNHDFHKTDDYDQLMTRLKEEEKSKADIIKLAVMPQKITDLTNLLLATSDFSTQCEKPLITMSMGEIGAMSRMTGEVFGSSVTFASAGVSSAPGQMPVQDLKKVLSRIHARTQTNENKD